MRFKKVVVTCAVSLLSAYSGVVLAGGKVARIQVLPVEQEVQTYIATHLGHEDEIEIGQVSYLVD